MESVSPGVRNARRSLRERWHDWRDRWFADPRFQRWAASFWPTRRIARDSASALFDLVAGFVYSQVLLACVRLQLFELLADGPADAGTLAARMSLPEDAARRLLDAAVALRLLERRSRDRYGLGVLGAALRGNPGAIAMIEHHAVLYDDLRDPVAMLRGAPTRLSGYWPYARGADVQAAPPLDDEHVAAYTRLMSQSQPLVATDILDAYPLDRHRRMLDVGGGDGSFAAHAAGRTPALAVTVFDLPPVAERARRRFEADGLSARASAVGGSFLHDPLPGGFDLVTLVRVVHDHDDLVVVRLLTAVHAALAPGARLLVAEPMAEPQHDGAMADAYFGIYLLAMGSGRPRNATELTSLLVAAGFTDVQVLRTRRPMLVGALLATRA